MLPKDLLVIIRKKGNVYPKYLRDEKVANSLISVFNDHIGNKFKELKHELNVFEDGNKTSNP